MSTFNVATGLWGTTSSAGRNGTVFTPDKTQPQDGYATKSTHSDRSGGTVNVYTWHEGVNPQVAIDAANAAKYTAIWGIDAAQFHAAVDPALGTGTSWSNGGNGGIKLTLANGQVWEPSGAEAGIIYHPAHPAGSVCLTAHR